MIPLRDGSWATLHADGRYEVAPGQAASPDKAMAYVLRFEDSISRKAITLGHLPAPLSFGAVSATRLPEGPLRVRTTVLSEHGLPKIRLDDRWDIAAVTPSPTSVSAYDVDFLLNDFSETPRRLKASGEGGEPAEVTFTPPPAVRDAPKHPRALLIANGTYADPSVKALPGALKDADDLALALGGAESWALDRDHLTVKKNLGADAMEKAIRSFFRDAAPEETLLFYYAGHGDRDGSEGYLVPVDYRPKKPAGRRISASALWGFIEGSKATQVVVILDACRAGAFLLPDSVVRRAPGKRVLFLTSTAAGASAKDTARGGPFTQALVEALGREDRVDPFFHAVTVYKAYLYAADLASDQSPRLFGNEKLDNIALAWPRPAGTHRVSTPVAITPGSADTELVDVKVELSSLVSDRQILAQVKVSVDQLEVSGRFAEDTDWLRIGVHDPADEQGKPKPLLFAQNGGQPWPKGQRFFFRIPLPLEELKHGTYRVEVEPCGVNKVCGRQAAKKFPITL